MLSFFVNFAEPPAPSPLLPLSQIPPPFPVCFKTSQVHPYSKANSFEMNTYEKTGGGGGMYVSSKFRQGIMRPRRQHKPVRHQIATRGGRVKRIKIAAGIGLGLAILCAAEAQAQKPPLLPEKDVAALANEVSGETAKRNLEGIARFHRQRGSKGFEEAAELVAERLRAYGLSDVAILQFPADGKIFYGTQRSRPAWDAEVGRLYAIQPEIEGTGGTSADGKTAFAGDSIVWNEKLLASYEAEPVVLAEDSETADVTADLVDVGDGTKESDY